MDLFIIQHCDDDENDLMGYLSQLDENGVKTLLATLNNYHLWKEFQKISVPLIKVLVTKIIQNVHSAIELLVEILKYSIVDPSVLQISNLFSYVPEIIEKVKEEEEYDELKSSLAILVMQRMPLSEQVYFYEEYKNIIKKTKNNRLKYYEPGKTNYPNGLYGIIPEDRIFINTKTAERKYKYIVEENVINGNGCNKKHEGEATVDENGIQILNRNGNGFEGRLYGNLFVKKENDKNYTIYNRMNDLINQRDCYQLYKNNNNDNSVDYNLLELNQDVEMSTEGDIEVNKGDEIHFMMKISGSINKEKWFLKIGSKRGKIIHFVVNKENKVEICYNEDDKSEICEKEVKPNEFIEIHHQFKDDVKGKLGIKKLNGSIFCIKISHTKEKEEVKYFWPLIVPYNLENIIHNDNDKGSNLVLNGFFDKVVRYLHIKLPYFYMNDYLYSFYSNESRIVIRNRYPIRIENIDNFQIKINIVGSITSLKYLKIVIDDGKGNDYKNNDKLMYNTEIVIKEEIEVEKEKKIIYKMTINDDHEMNYVISDFQKDDIDNTFSFLFSPNVVNFNFRKDNNYDGDMYTCNNIKIDKNTDYYITTETDMQFENYKVNIVGQKKNYSKDDGFINGNNQYKIEVEEESPEADFFGYNLLHKENKFNGIIEYNDDPDNKDHKGRYNNNENSLIEIKKNGDLCVIRRDKSANPNQLDKCQFNMPTIYDKYEDHRIGIKNSSAPGIKNACYMICAFQGLYNSNEILNLSYNDYEEKDSIIKCVYKILHDLDIANYSINLTQFVEEMCKIGKFADFTYNNQQDSAEFLELLLDYCIEKSEHVREYFTSKAHTLTLCMNCEKREERDAGDHNILECFLPQRFFPIYKIRYKKDDYVLKKLNKYDDNDEEEDDDDEKDKIIDIVFSSDEVPRNIMYVSRKTKPVRGDQYLTLISNETNNEYENDENVKCKTLKIGNTKLYCYYDSIHPPITNIKVVESMKNSSNDYCAEFAIKNRNYKISCVYDLPIVEGGIYEPEIAKRYIKEHNEEIKRRCEKSEDVQHTIIDVKDRKNDKGYEKKHTKNEKNFTTLKIGTFISNGKKLKIRDEIVIHRVKIEVSYNNSVYSDEGFLVFDENCTYFWGSNSYSIYIEIYDRKKIKNCKCDLYMFKWDKKFILDARGDISSISDNSIYSYYAVNDNSLFIHLFLSTSTTPPVPIIPQSYSGYIGEFFYDNNDEEDDENDNITEILVIQNTVIYFNKDTHTITNETLTTENCKEIMKNKYYIKESEEIMYKNVLPFYRCYDVSLQSMIEKHLYDCEVGERGCECKKGKEKSNKLIYSFMLESDLPQYLLFTNNSEEDNFIKISPTIKIRQNNFPYKDVDYAVYGLILHCGTNEGGHYTCYFRRSESRNIRKADDEENCWYFFDDEIAVTRNWEEILTNLLCTPLTRIRKVFLSRIDDKSKDHHKCKGIEMIKPIGGLEDDLYYRLYDMYYPPLLKEFDDYKKDAGKLDLEKKEFEVKKIKPKICGCGKKYYPFK